MATTPELTLFRTPLLERFELRGLYGYKNLGLSCETNAKIISAENGSGKTTLLNALYGFMTGRIGALLALDFSQLVLKLTNASEIRVNKRDLFPESDAEFLKGLTESRVGREWLAFGCAPVDIRSTLILYATGSPEYQHTPAFRKMYEDTPYSRDDVRTGLQNLLPLLSSIGSMSEFQKQIKASLRATTVLYLPTYRRIEADLPEYRRAVRVRNAERRSEWDTDRLIFFGLQDVEQRLKAVSEEIRNSTFEAYAKISARTLDQLLYIQPAPKLDPGSVDIETLKLVLGRLGKTETESESRIRDLITSQRINSPEYASLRSFLAQLAEIYKEKREAELAIETFASVVNRYWGHSTDRKELRFDKVKLEVQAYNVVTEKPLPLAALSSGEKQILSVFARLYLDWGKRYLILIDEPELSLSLEWQQSFLPDVMRTPSCDQLIAITHSPFVFENELDKVAGSLEVSYLIKEND